MCISLLSWRRRDPNELLRCLYIKLASLVSVARKCRVSTIRISHFLGKLKRRNYVFTLITFFVIVELWDRYHCVQNPYLQFVTNLVSYKSWVYTRHKNKKLFNISILNFDIFNSIILNFNNALQQHNIFLCIKFHVFMAAIVQTTTDGRMASWKSLCLSPKPWNAKISSKTKITIFTLYLVKCLSKRENYRYLDNCHFKIFVIIHISLVQ